MGFDELVQHDASELTNGTLPAGRLPADGKFVNSLKVATGGFRPLEISEYIDGGGGDGIQYKTEGSQHFIIDENDSNTNRSFSVRTDGTNFTNSDPLLLVTDEPEVGIGFGDPINSLGISGGAVIGSGFAGSNTAPTDGLLVEGGFAVGTTSIANFETAVISDPSTSRVNINTTSGSFSTGNRAASVTLSISDNFVGQISAIVGDDTSNLDEADLVFQTASGGSLLNVMRLQQEGHVNLGCPTAGSLITSDMENGSVSFEVDENNNELDVTVKKSGGTVVTGTVPLS